jgi:hypothetical protein
MPLSPEEVAERIRRPVLCSFGYSMSVFIIILITLVGAVKEKTHKPTSQD